MRNDLDKVIQVRSTYQAIQQMTGDVDLLLNSMAAMEGGDVPEELMARKSLAESSLKKLRVRYMDEVGQAIQAADKLPRIERRVIYLYYVCGLSIGKIALEMHYSRRSVLRLKRGALEKLREGGGYEH